MKYYDLILGAFVLVLVLSNTTSTKIVQLGPFTFDGGTVLFPLAYIFGDILTEVYGYKKARRVIWAGFCAIIVMALLYGIVGWLPAAAGWDHQDAYNVILGVVPRIVLASLVAYFAGEFSNSYLLAKIKVWMKGRLLFVRTIGSTLVGEGVDSFLFVLIAFYGVLDTQLLVSIFLSNYVFKVAVEVLMTPVTYAIVGYLKRNEKLDVYDQDTDFNPFTL